MKFLVVVSRRDFPSCKEMVSMVGSRLLRNLVPVGVHVTIS